MRIDSTVTSGKFRLDGGEWDVDNNVYVVGDDSSVYVVDPSHDLDAVAAVSYTHLTLPTNREV